MLGAGEIAPGVLAVQKDMLTDLPSDEESVSVLSDPFGERDADLQNTCEIEAEPSESLSWLEDVLEEVGDEQLFDGRKSYSGIPLLSHVHELTRIQRKTPARWRKRARTDSFCVQ